MAKSATRSPLSIATTIGVLVCCAKAHVSALLEGPPGVGKTSIIRELGKLLSLPVHILIGSNCDPVDIAGLPWIDQGKLLRALYPEIQACIDAPGILFLDELTTVPPSVQAPLMRVFLEHNCGGVSLHRDTVIFAACNPPEHAPNAVELSAATVNRIGRYPFCPTLDEVKGWFSSRPEKWGVEGRDFAATLEAEPGLVQFEPPQASIDAGASWGSPRAWELGLRAFAEHGKDDDLGLEILSGFTGPDQALAYLAIKRMRTHLPSISTIQGDPASAPVPANRSHQIAALGLLARVADTDAWAAWVYAARLEPEIGAACGRVLLNRQPQASRHSQAGKASQIKLLASVKKGVK